MDDKIMLVFLFIAIAIVILLLWNNLTLERIKKIKVNGEEHFSDDKYFELKYKIQYISFAFALIIASAGMFGYGSIQEIKSDIYKELITITDLHKQRTDSLISNRIDVASRDINEALEMFKESSDLAHKLLSKYVNNVNEIQEKLGYENLYIVQNFTITGKSNGERKITFKELGFNSFHAVPTVFIEPKTDASIKLNAVTKDYFILSINSTSGENVNMSIMIFN